MATNYPVFTETSYGYHWLQNNPQYSDAALLARREEIMKQFCRPSLFRRFIIALFN